MSKLSNLAGIPSMGGGAGSNVMGPLKGMAPGWDGVPTGVPSGLHKAVGDVSSPLGGLQAKGDGTPEWRNAPIDVGQNELVNPAAPAPTPKGYSVWGDPDMTKRGWGWGMGADGALHTGVMGGGPAGSPWGPQSGGAPVPQATGQAASNLGQLGHAIAGGMQGLSGGASGLPGFGQALAQGMRQFNANGGMGGTPGQGQQGPAMPASGPQGMAPGAIPQGGPPMGAMGPGQNPQAVQQLIAQMRMQQQGQAQPGQPGSQ